MSAEGNMLSARTDLAFASACDSVNGEVNAGGETPERSRSETTVAVPQAEARRTFDAVRMPLVMSALFAELNRRGREGKGPTISR